MARQPIFDSRQNVVAYELLFRSGLENCFPQNIDLDHASSKVINDTLTVFDLDALSSGKKIYVNVTRKVLCEGLYQALPPRRTVVELLESISADHETMNAVRAARAAGYDVALDDFVARPETEPFVSMANVLKVDFTVTNKDERGKMLARYRGKKVTLLAEKVETSAEFEEARRIGYNLFQGYFFQRPEIIAREDIPPTKMNYVRFLRELQAPDLNFDSLERVIKHDVSLSVRLLKFLNSAAFGWKSRVTSLKHAIVLLGERPFRRWASLVAVVGMMDDRPAELALECLVRAGFAERLAPLAGLGGRELDAFLVGLLSALDAMMGRPLPELLSEISVSAEIDAALLRTDTPLGLLRALVIGHERGDWTEVSSLARRLGIPEDAMPDLARESVQWATATLPTGRI